VPIEVRPNDENRRYLDAKRDKLGHTLHHQGLPLDEQLLHEEHVKDAERDERPRDYPPGD
jgi:3,4-dihydroxy 2-butanone 4-phosphate synthase/GTP cyclohydrolase II